MPPRQAMMSLMSACVAASSVASGGMTPSPLSGLAEKIFAVSDGVRDRNGVGALSADAGQNLFRRGENDLALPAWCR